MNPSTAPLGHVGFLELLVEEELPVAEIVKPRAFLDGQRARHVRAEVEVGRDLVPLGGEGDPADAVQREVAGSELTLDAYGLARIVWQ